MNLMGFVSVRYVVFDVLMYFFIEIFVGIFNYININGICE